MQQPVAPAAVLPLGPTAAPIPTQVLDPRYAAMICFNCGDPGHFVGNCIREKVCFICNLPSHHVDNCPDWVTPHPLSAYFGSAASRLGFYHIDAPVATQTQWINFRNCGVVTVRRGEVMQAELENYLSAAFCKAQLWPWQIRQLKAKEFLVRFPPWKSVNELIELPAFDLVMDTVTVKITKWTGDALEYGELQTVWVQVEGIPPKWNAWTVLAQLASCYGLLVNVDWQFGFKNFFHKAHIQIASMDPYKIPAQRVVEMKEKLYLLSLTVEDLIEIDADGSGNDGDDHNGDDEDGFDGLDDGEDNTDTNMDNAVVDKAGASNTKTPPVAKNNPSAHKTVMGTNLGAAADDMPIFARGEAAPPTPVREKQILDDPVSAETLFLSSLDIARLTLTPPGGHDSMSKSYCSQILRDLDEDCNSDEEQEQATELLDANLIQMIGSTKRNLFPSPKMHADAPELLPSPAAAPATNKWGPVQAPRQSKRNAGKGNILEKAKKLKMRQNLEIPPMFKGKALDKHEGRMVYDDQDAAAMAATLQVSYSVGWWHQDLRAHPWRASENCLDPKLLSPSLTDEERRHNLAVHTNWAISP